MTEPIEGFTADLEAKLANIEQYGAYKHYRPLSEAMDEFVRFSQNPQLRVYTGIPEFDAEMRGVAPREFCLINGFAHNGKTILATEIIEANLDKPIVVFTPDETRPALLVKLAAATSAVGAEELERRIRNGDQTAIDILQNVCDTHQNLAVFDDKITLHAMDRMFDEAAKALGRRPVAVIFDYASLLADEMDVVGKLDALKAWGKNHDVAFFCLHQTSRSSGGNGAELSMESGSYGGEQQATFIIGVRRKINYYLGRISELEAKLAQTTNERQAQRYQDEIYDIQFDLIPRHKDTISCGLLKNKRPPMRLVPELDFRLDTETGRIIRIEKDDEGDQPDKSVELPYETATSAMGLLKGR